MDSDINQLNVQTCSLTVEYTSVANNQKQSLNVTCKQLEDAKLWYFGLSHLIDMCQHGQNITTQRNVEAAVEKHKGMNNAIVLLAMKEMSAGGDILRSRRLWKKKTQSCQNDSNYVKLMNQHNVLRREWKWCVDQMNKLKKRNIVDSNALIFTKIQTILQTFDVSLWRIHNELLAYCEHYIENMKEPIHFNDENSEHDHKNGNVNTISSPPEEYQNRLMVPLSSFEKPWNMEQIDIPATSEQSKRASSTSESDMHSTAFIQTKNDFQNEELNEKKRSNEKEEDVSPYVTIKNRYQVIADVHIELVSLLVDLYAWKAKIRKVVWEPFVFV